MGLTIVGKHNDLPDIEFDKKELEKGIKVEFEHTGSFEIAKSIAKDHLVEFRDYYSRLEVLEKNDFWDIISAGLLLLEQAKKLNKK